MSAVAKSPITTHILDTSRGCAAADVPVTLYRHVQADDSWLAVQQRSTNADGRCGDLIAQSLFEDGASPDGTQTFKLRFEVGEYYARTRQPTLYPFVEVVFITNAKEKSHYHIPLLLNPYGYSTYRGT